MTPVSTVSDNWSDVASDWIALAVAAATLAGIVWGAVMRATRPLRARLDEIHTIAEGLKAERERVDDLSDRVAGLERQLGAIERRIEDLYHLLLAIIDPRHRQRPPDEQSDE